MEEPQSQLLGCSLPRKSFSLTVINKASPHVWKPQGLFLPKAEAPARGHGKRRRLWWCLSSLLHSPQPCGTRSLQTA